MSLPPVVGIIGKKYAGKDTFADVLVKEGGYVRRAFADPLKQEVADFLGVTVKYVEAHKAELRLALQLRGTEYWRQINQDHWINLMDDWMVGGAYRGIVIPDVRFLNEAKFVENQGGKLVKLIRADCVGNDGDSHASEVEQDQIEGAYEWTCCSPDEVESYAHVLLREWRREETKA